ncbi:MULTISPECIES: peroxiredoxin-like family protein [Protofrankia]|uniref:thioredoxin-dependent peroxiredoxin n=1 Tax=Protofrankia coriariae TaxID=1562887 RepID=A0ABR5F6W4_9ACTN|nr:MULTISPECIES: peroxiredoxin-like family protein [Protofrankia]KLL12467.1 hypothetical protein FrCorBMG51_04015 [Protofrankia coriariae]ONH35543.1 hypothetical protein BL254_11415 [Protofrankia sp. BMG5.30]
MSTTSTPATSLTDAAVRLRAQLRDQFGDALDPFDAEADMLATRSIAAGAPAVGAPAPDFTLPDVHGADVTLSTLLARGPIVVVFYRGAWCPYCNLQLNAFQTALDDIEAAGATLVAISPQTPDSSLTFTEQQQLRFTVLSDVHNTVARAYGLVFRQADAPTAMQKQLGIDLEQVNGDDSHELPAASTFVIDTEGTVRFAAVSSDYRWRVGPDEVLTVLRETR